MNLRYAVLSDWEGLMALLSAHQDGFLNDYDLLDAAFIARLISRKEIIVIATPNQKAIGLFWFENAVFGLKTDIHILVDPKWWRPILKAGLVARGLDYAFEHLQVNKIKAQVMRSQKTAIKLLHQHKFTCCAHLRHDTRHHGELMDVMIFELFKTDWNTYKEKQRNGII